MAANPGRYSHLPRNIPQWASTVGHMILSEAIVNACCSTCGLWRRADLDRIAKAKGLNYSLYDRQVKCPTPGCVGKVFFHASPGEGTPSRPCRT